MKSKKIKISKQALRIALIRTDIGGYRSLLSPWMINDPGIEEMEKAIDEDTERLFKLLTEIGPSYD